MASTSTALPTAPKQCDICLLSKENDFLYGELMTKFNITVHYFCLLSGKDILQKGLGNTGFLGFRKGDIIESFKSYRHLACVFCKSNSAPVHCSFEGCHRTWHHPCGVENNCIVQFTGEFKAFCHLHVPDPNGGREPDENASCKACMEPLGPISLANCIISSCCLKLYDWPHSFLHKECITKYCKNAGYDSMCVTCGMEGGPTKEEWQTEMRLKGVFIPMQEAIWENDEYFKKQVKNKCEERGCARKSNDVYTCFVCGCFPRHLSCAKVYHHKDYYCPKCFDQSFVQRVPL